MKDSQKQKVLKRLNLLLEESNSALLEQLIDDSEDFVLAYTHRTMIPDGLIKTVGDLALVAYNRLGTEGESGRSEAGESYSFESAPAQIFSVLNKYRIARCGGYAHEKKQD